MHFYEIAKGINVHANGDELSRRSNETLRGNAAARSASHLYAEGGRGYLLLAPGNISPFSFSRVRFQISRQNIHYGHER